MAVFNLIPKTERCTEPKSIFSLVIVIFNNEIDFSLAFFSELVIGILILFMFLENFNK